MGTKIICPKCRNSIKIGEKVALVGKTKTGLKGIILLSTTIGDYTVEFSDDFTIVEGNIVKFICPICHKNLSRKKNKNLATIIGINDEGIESSIVFSKIYGEQNTYSVEGAVVK